MVAEFGVEPEKTTADDARRVNGSLIRDRLLRELDGRLGGGRSPDVLALLVAADPDEYRNGVRAAVQAGDDARVGQLGDEPAALTQPARFAVVLARLPQLPFGRREEILRVAHPDRPANAAVLHALAAGTGVFTPEAAAARLRWHQALLTIRPTSPSAWWSLGLELALKGDVDEAVACHHRAIALSHAYLGMTLSAKGDLDGAAAAHREAVRLDPALIRAWSWLSDTHLIHGPVEGVCSRGAGGSPARATGRRAACTTNQTPPTGS